MNIESLFDYTVEDSEKKFLIEEALGLIEKSKVFFLSAPDFADYGYDYVAEPAKFCPKCGMKFPEDENFCFKCLVKLNEIDKINVRNIEFDPEFEIKNQYAFENFNEIFCEENLKRIDEFNFTIDDWNHIINNIKLTALKRFDDGLKENKLHVDLLTILEKILLFVKSFVNVEYKSYGQELGYYEFNRIYIDDRQIDVLQITTLLHELSHFLLKEILCHVLCKVLECRKTKEIESIVTFILSYSPMNQLMDEYAAHTVEGRFSLFGYQDYSSFLNIQETLSNPPEEIEMIKTIANTFSTLIKDILESFIDYDLLEDIKDQFKKDILNEPDYKNLELENCSLLNDFGLIQSLQLILFEGFVVSMDNVETLKKYNDNW